MSVEIAHTHASTSRFEDIPVGEFFLDDKEYLHVKASEELSLDLTLGYSCLSHEDTDNAYRRVNVRIEVL